MREGVASNTNARGTVSWKAVRSYMQLRGGRTMGMLQLKAKWEHLRGLSQYSMYVTDSVRPIVRMREG